MAGEAGGVAEGVEHVPVPAQGAHSGAVLSLVQVEPGLVAGADRHLEGHAILDDPNRPGPGASGPAEGRREPLQTGRGRVVHVEDGRVGKDAPERGREQGPGARHPQGEALGDQDGPVAVDDQPGQPVGLAPDQPAERRRPL